MKKIIFFCLAWFLLVNIFAILVFNRFSLTNDTAYIWIDSHKATQAQSWNPINLHARWDSEYYIGIASRGYHLTEGNALSNIVFFPLYPLLLFLAAPLFAGNMILAGWAISTLSLVGSCIILHKMVKEFHPSLDADLSIFYLLIFPTAFFLNVVYTESLFLLLSLLTFQNAFRGRFSRAGIFGLLAACTRITGVLLFIPVVWEFYKKYKERKVENVHFLSLLLIPLGTASFFLYHHFAFGNGFLFFEVEKAWGRTFELNSDHFKLFSRPASVNLFLDTLFVIFGLIAAYIMFYKKWIAYGLYTSATIMVALSTGTFMSIGRYLLVLFPIYIVIASIKNQNVSRIFTVGSVLLLAMYITLFVNDYWAG